MAVFHQNPAEVERWVGDHAVFLPQLDETSTKLKNLKTLSV
jgi:hypothetical protein